LPRATVHLSIAHRYFVSELEGSPEATAIIRAVMALGRSLSIPILAEGIETQDQLDVLIREGCDEVQGFLLGYPGPSPVEMAAPSGEAPPARPEAGLSNAA
jgi:EAL domain-containing protein (putative c-di-GMP-specific phosphodiesterase class I)